MAIIHPYSDSAKYGTGGIWQPTAANFPALKHFWSCPQTDIGKNSLTDSIGGCNLILASGTIAAGTDAFSVLPSAVAAGTTLGGTLVVPGNNMLLVAAATWGGTAGFVLGDGANGAAISLAAANFITDSGANSASGTSFSIVSAYSMRATLVKTYNAAAAATTGQTQYEANATTTITQATNAATTGCTSLTGWGGTNKWACTSGAASTFYGAALFKFSSLPSAGVIKSAVAWMAYQWSIGNKWISPDLKGIS